MERHMHTATAAAGTSGGSGGSPSPSAPAVGSVLLPQLGGAPGSESKPAGSTASTPRLRLYCTVLAQLAGGARVAVLYCTVQALLAGGAGAAVLFCATVLYCIRTASWGSRCGCTLLYSHS